MAQECMRVDKSFFQKVLNTQGKHVEWRGEKDPLFDSCYIDSREIALHNATFFALQGDKVDGHDFVKQAYAQGARTFVIEKSKEQKVLAALADVLSDCALVIVNEVLSSLVEVATAWRAQFTLPVIGITGSVGKTTTKELLATIVTLGGKNCLATVGNRNTLVSVALRLLMLRPEHDCAIIEMSTNKRGEIAALAHMVRPTIAIITAIAHSHMEGLGSLQDIATEKRDIFKYFKESNIGIINGDQPILAGISYSHPVVKFGLKTVNQVQARKVNINNGCTTCVLKLYGDRYPLQLQTIHTGRLMSSLACAAAAYLLDIPHEIIVQGLSQAPVVPGRFEIKKIGTPKGVVVNDCYNASPESMKEALLAFERMETRGKKIAVLGDMLELGVNTPFWHRQLGRTLRKAPSVSRIIFVGKHIKAAQDLVPHSIPFTSVANWQEAVAELRNYLEDDVAVLVKASNGMGLKNLVETIVGAS